MEKMPITITLNMLQKCNPSNSLWGKLSKSLNKTEADDEPLRFSQIAESNGVPDAIWCLRALQGYKTEKSLLAAEIAESVLHIFEGRYPNDKRVRECIQGARDFIAGKITKEELLALRRASASTAHAYAADAAARPAAAAAYASVSAAYAAYAADASSAYATDAYAGYTAALAVALTARNDEKSKQKELIIKYFG